MGYKNDDKCIIKAFDDEKLFVLMARDITAPKIILEWIKENLFAQPDDKLREAFEAALEMKRNMAHFRSEATKQAIDKMMDKNQ